MDDVMRNGWGAVRGTVTGLGKGAGMPVPYVSYIAAAGSHDG